jgi:hypothetical protein
MALAGCGIEAGTDDLPGLRIATPTDQEVPEAARVAIAKAVRDRVDADVWSVIGLRWEGDWALATVTPTDLDVPLADDQETHLRMDNLYALLLVRTEDGWRAALEGDARVHALLDRVPESALPQAARTAIFPTKGDQPAKAYGGYKFFWPAGPAWRTTQSWHDSYTWGGNYPAYTSLDFDIVGASNSDILAGASGTITHWCNDGTQVLLGITTDGTSEKLGYLHLTSSSVSGQGISLGSWVPQGAKLGQMLNTDGGSISTSCGYSIGTHVHMYFPEKPITLDGLTFSDSNVHWGENLYSSQGSCSTASLTVPSDRWRLQIWNNRYQSGTEAEIKYDFVGSGGFSVNWGGGAPTGCTGADNFSIRFKRSAYFASSGYYDFTTTADDGVKVRVDGNQIINGWVDQAPTTYTAQTWVNAGWHTLRVDYYENGGGATASLSWAPSGGGNPYPSCPCDRADNYCQHGPSTSGCPMTYPGGYCDPNGDGGYGDGDWVLGWTEYNNYCL